MVTAPGEPRVTTNSGWARLASRYAGVSFDEAFFVRRKLLGILGL